MKGQQTAGNSRQMDAQSEIIGVCVKKGGTESGVNVTNPSLWQDSMLSLPLATSDGSL